MISSKHEFIKRIKRIKFRTLSVFFLLVIFASCNSSLRFASVKYDAAAINHLLDSTNMKYLTILYNSPNGSSYKNAFTLISYARDSTGGYLTTPAYDLEPSDKMSKTFTGKMILGNLTLERDSIIALLTDPATGKRKRDFSYLLFIPRQDKDYNYIYYDIKVKGSSSAVGDSSLQSLTVARPCPPAKGCKVIN